MNKTALEKLVRAGALDCLGGHRRQLLQAVPRALQAAVSRQEDRRRGQRNLFDAFGGDGAEAAPVVTAEALPDVPEWPEAEKLKYEKEVLDFYFSSHPLAQREKELRRFASHTADQLKQLPADQEVTLGGLMVEVEYRNTKKARNGNSRYLVCKVEDMTGAVKCVMWPDDLVRYKDEVREDARLFRQGRRGPPAQRAGADPQPHPQRRAGHARAGARAVPAAQGRRPRAVAPRGARADPDAARGRLSGDADVRDRSGKDVVLKLGREYAVNPAAYPHDDLERLLGEGCVKLA